MATGILTPWPRFVVLNAAGKPISGALLNTYIAGTTTPIATYSDVALTVANANPIVANSSGQIGPVFLSPGSSYKFVFTNPDASALFTQDNIAAGGGATNTDIIGVAGEALTANKVAYLSDGSGGKTAGLWYLADSANTYSSTTAEVGIVPASIASAGTGAFRLGGAITGLTSLTVGASYYVGTSGALTSTAPANARKLGVADTTSSLVLWQIPPSATVDNTICDARLTLTTGVPITTADVTAATNVFLIPYKGNRIALFDGASWNIRTFTQLTQALGTLSSGKPYDVFAFDNAGVVATEILAWTNDTTRATALANQDGVLSKTGALTRRYMGTFYTTSTTTTEDSFAKRNLWNYYNRVPREMFVKEATDSWAYSTNTYRQANAAAANQLEFMLGVAETPVESFVIANASSNNVSSQMWVAIGQDSTSVADVACLVGTGLGFNVGFPLGIQAQLRKYPVEGRHVWVWLEKAVTGTITFYGDNGADGTQSGIHGVLLG